MAVTTDIARTWIRPRKVMRELLSQGVREDRAIAYIMVACFVVFISRLPGIQYNVIQGVGDFQRDASYAFMGLMMFAPLIFYLFAALVHLILKVVGGKGSFFSVRLAIFWVFLASTPALLLYGLTIGLIGPGAQANLVGYVWLIGFVWMLVPSVWEAEQS